MKNIRQLLLVLVFTVFGIGWMGGPLWGQSFSTTEKAQISVQPLTSGVEKNAGTIPVAVMLEIKKGWHLQANHPFDQMEKTTVRGALSEEGETKSFSGYRTKNGLYPTYIDVVGPEGATLDTQKFPEGHSYEVPGFGQVKVLSGTVRAYAEIHLDQVPDPGEKIKLKLRIVGQACDNKSCLRPGFWTESLTVPVLSEKPEPVNVSLRERLEEQLGHTLQTSDKETQETSPQQDGQPKGDLREQLHNLSKEVEQLKARLEQNQSAASQPSQSQQTASSADGKKTRSYAPPERSPEKVVEALGLSIGTRQKSVFHKKIEKSLWLALIAAFLWGMAASLSPCVYPMIPLTLSFFGGQVGGDDEADTVLGKNLQVFAMALVFVVGVTVTFSILGVVAALLNFEMGSLLGNPWFVGGIIVLFVFLSFSMMGYYEIPVPSFLRQMGQGKQGYIGAFVMGLFLGIIAAPCVGPFAAAILAFIAATGNVTLGFLGMSAFGLGLGMLFLVLALFGGGIQSIGTGAAWLTHVKTFFGFVLLGATLYFLDLLLNLIRAASVGSWLVPLLTGLLAMVFGFWLWHIVDDPGEEEHMVAGRMMLRSLGVLVILTGVYFSMGGVIRSEVLLPAPSWWQSEETHSELQWVHDFRAGVEKAKKKGKPFFVDFYADWCIPCQEMEEEVFSDPEVVRYVHQHFVPIKLDVTEGDSWNSKLKHRVFDTAGIPFVPFFDRRGDYRSDLSKDGKLTKEEFLNRARDVIRSSSAPGS